MWWVQGTQGGLTWLAGEQLCWELPGEVGAGSTEPLQICSSLPRFIRRPLNGLSQCDVVEILEERGCM